MVRIPGPICGGQRQGWEDPWSLRPRPRSSDTHVGSRPGQTQHVLPCICSWVSRAGVNGKHPFDPAPEEGRGWGVGVGGKLSKTEASAFLREDKKGSLIERGLDAGLSASILLTASIGTCEISNLIKEGFAGCLLPRSPLHRPPNCGQDIWYGSSFSVMGLFGAWLGWGT